GIPPDQWERIFDRYHRLDSDRSNPGGVGVGLSVSRLLARLMGGDVTYEYRNGMSLFEVTLPALTGALGTEWETSSVPSQA
ncbi:MAG: ATP-binding protein, partial [Actinomycetota bacterium]